jgi:hypothetical protein
MSGPGIDPRDRGNPSTVSSSNRRSARLRLVALGYVALLIFVYVVVAVHTPLALYPGAGYDDGLYISLGRSLAGGHWLGPYNNVTLIKGPGYPAFLAGVQWLGLPLSLAHALFYCLAVSAFVIVLQRFIRSLLLSCLLFTLLLWHPISLSIFLLRAVRDNIYYGQTLLILASLVAVLFVPLERSRKILVSVICGLLLGWFWLTREEGVWIVPGIAIMVATAGWTAFRLRKLRDLLAPLTIVVCIFAVMQVGFRTANLWAYGKFSGVEAKDKNFERALGAINGVLSGGNKPFVSATATARGRIYAVSPAFASLKGYFDNPNRANWEKVSCDAYAVCGEIAGGWFMWALRDAAAQNGHLASPASASAFFRQIADEVSAACTQGKLECSPQLIPEMPQTSLGQLAERLPSRYLRAAHLLLLTNPPLQIMPSSGTEAQLTPVLRFLNYPVFTKSPDWVVAPTKYRLSAWYYRTGSDWIVASVNNADGTPAQAQLSRLASPDLQNGFKDPAASQQRFVLDTICVDRCVLQIETPEGQKSEKTLGQVRTDATDIAVGGGKVHIDSTEVESDSSAPTGIERFCNVVRVVVLSHYSWLSIPVLFAGILSFLIATALYWRIALRDVCYVMALVSWLLVVVRGSLIILIDATSFFALDPLYLAPAYFLLMSGAVLSCAAFLNLAFPRVEPRKMPA